MPGTGLNALQHVSHLTSEYSCKGCLSGLIEGNIIAERTR